MRQGWRLFTGCIAPLAGIVALMGDATGKASASTDAARPVPGQACSLDLGGDVKLEFVWVDALGGWVGKYEVTNGQYQLFKPSHDSATYHGPPVTSLRGDRRPVCYECYTDAVAFAEWATKTAGAQLPAGHVVRLPDGDEWTTFAQCGDDRKFPWGSEWPPEYGNYRDETGSKAFAHWKGVRIEGYDDGFDVACAVEQSGKNDWGLYGVGFRVVLMPASAREPSEPLGKATDSAKERPAPPAAAGGSGRRHGKAGAEADRDPGGHAR